MLTVTKLYTTSWSPMAKNPNKKYSFVLRDSKKKTWHWQVNWADGEPLIRSDPLKTFREARDAMGEWMNIHRNDPKEG